MHPSLDTPFAAPKALLIRNQSRGMSWQVYFVRNTLEIKLHMQIARAHGFSSFETCDTPEEFEETWPGWRDSEAWQSRYKDALAELHVE